MEYISSIQKYFSDTNSSEHSYRTTFENYLKEIFPIKDDYFTQQDQRAVNGNKPDFVVLKNKIPVLYIEVKKVGEDLDKIEKSNQADRYFGYDNLIISDYVEFRFFRNGQKYGEPISLASINKKDHLLEPTKDIAVLTQTILDFIKSHKEPIKHGKHLAQIMGGKAQRIRDNVRDMLISENEVYSDLLKMKEVVRENLVSSLDNESFADMYAQTLVYGLFAARYNDNTADTFSRAEARDLVPKTNPFLRSFFDHIAGTTFPERLRFIVDELCEAFSHADVHKLLTDFYGTEKESKDPIIHFYEDFLKEYDAKKKMDMGVFYTPRPVVRFIVHAVDSLLKSEFGLAKGLADTAKISIDKKEIDPKTGKEKKVSKEFHRVQVLDVATGTGTFLNEVIHHIHKGFVGQEGRWDAYVKSDLLPRLHGFELMMASYTIAHLKLGMTLQDLGAKNVNDRLGVYLTNTLEAPVDYTNQNTLFGIMDSIADEAKSASRVKSEYPIMCVIGNPPYSGISQNKDYIDNSVYKVEPGGKVKLQERKHWLDDDYVKFIRFAESLVEKNGEGVIGMITAHGYIDNPTFRGMRWHLRKTFDKIYVIDLHGNSTKKETTPDGSKDENVFDIKTGVSIILGVKNNTKASDLADVYKADFYGLREEKFAKLDSENVESVSWTRLPIETELWVLQGKGKVEYEKGFSVAEIFPKNTTGIVTGIDRLSIFETKEDLQKTTKAILSSNDPYLEFGIKDGRRVKKEARVAELREAFENNTLTSISYRPFDTRHMYYTTGSEVWINSPRPDVMRHFVNRENLGLVFMRQATDDSDYNHILLTKDIVDNRFMYSGKGITLMNPLYLYADQNEKVPNLKKEIWDKINDVAGETTPENILDYIYAVLHSPTYREKYKEFLKIDFPRVPYPESKEKFFALAKIGEKLRGLHLMTDPILSLSDVPLLHPGNNIVEKVKFIKGGNVSINGSKINQDSGYVWINDTQCFGNVPEVAWNFYIGGYQPAQKYLKDQKGRKLSNNEIEHYQKIIKVLVETNRLMKEIDHV